MTWNNFTVCKKRAQARLRMLFTKCVYKSYVYLIYMYKPYLALNNLQWLICHKIKLKQIIFAQFPSSFSSMRLLYVHVVHPYCSIDTPATWKKSRYILSDRSNFYMIDNLSIAIHAFARYICIYIYNEKFQFNGFKIKPLPKFQMMHRYVHIVVRGKNWRCRIFRKTIDSHRLNN